MVWRILAAGAFLMVAGCQPGPLRLEIPAVSGTQGLLVAIGPEGGAPSLYAVDPQHPEQLPPIGTLAPSENRVLRVLHYGQSLPRLRLSAGIQRLAGDSPISRPLLPPLQLESATVRGGDSAVEWSVESFGPPLSELRLPEDCTGAGIPEVGPDDRPSCPLPPVDRSTICWGQPELWSEISAWSGPNTHHDGGGLELLEGGRRYFYFASNRFDLTAEGSFTRPVRVLLDGAAALPPVEDLGLLPPPETLPLGWTGAPMLRSDALELFADSTWPTTQYCDAQLFSAARSEVGRSFGPLTQLESLQRPHSLPDCTRPGSDERFAQRAPVLLPDYRTLLFFEGYSGQIVAARRTSTIAGDLSFVRVPDFAVRLFEDDRIHTLGVLSLSLSCDRKHVLISPQLADGQPPRQLLAEIVSLEPLKLGLLEPLRGAGGQPFLWRIEGDPGLSAIEAPDCQTLYVSNSFSVYRAPRLASCQP